MTYHGSCHCGRIAFDVDAEIDQVVDCNCSMCQRRGGLLFFVARDALRLSTPESDLGTYQFGKKRIQHRFCTTCGVAPFSEGPSPAGKPMAAVNARCIEGIDLSALKVLPFDGRSV